MAKIELEISKEEFDNFHNAVVAYTDVLSRSLLGCEVPSKFEKIQELSEDEIRAKIKLITEFYNRVKKEGKFE